MNGSGEVLLRRRRLVAPGLLATGRRLPLPVGKLPRRLGMVPADVPSGVAALEFELLQLGFVVSGELYRELCGLSVTDLTIVGRRLLHGLREELGVNDSHVPLFRKFPESVPADTTNFYVRRVFALLLQNPQRPCVLCGESGVVHPVSPCAHLVCRTCWDGSDFSACPICHRRIDPDDPFLVPSEREITPTRDAVTTTVLLRLCADPSGTCRELAAELLARRTPMPPHERADLERLLEDQWPRSLSWLAEPIPVKETLAAVVAWALRKGADHELLDRHTGTATDVLRVLYALMDADPGLRVAPERRRSLPRAVRRAVLARLDALPYLLEDLLRYREQWKHLAEVLHPHEHQARFPEAALAFAALRGTRLDPATPFGRALLARADGHRDVEVRDGRVRVRTFASRVEQALAEGRHAEATALLSRRPGELLRRLSHVLRLTYAPVPSGPPPVRVMAGTGQRVKTGAAPMTPAVAPGEVAPLGAPGEAWPHGEHGSPAARGEAGLPEAAGVDPLGVLEKAVRGVAPGVLLAVLGQVRTPPGGARLFLPRGGAARMWTVPDNRPALPDEVVLTAERVLTEELLRRAGELPSLRRALLDEGLADLVAPTSERAASAALVRLVRGSVQPIPKADQLRFFLHWAEPPGTRVDLDLSVAVYDDGWRFAGLCDYTRLRLGNSLTHSGDLTSAPVPLGASEFIDVNVRNLRARYLVPVVFSYNDVPFDELVRGFAGFMERPRGLFDPVAVRQRFNLAGTAKILVPLVADLWTRTMRWADLNLSAAGYGHNVAGSADELAALGGALESAFEHRVTMWEVGCWHAAARAADVVVRRRDGSLTRYERRPDEGVPDFAARLAARADAPAFDGPLDEVELAALVSGDVELPGAQAYALYPYALGEARLLDAADLLSGLTPGS
ncbi:RING finger family 4 domain-containing protein [Nonomuraea sp. PA05]|uniref:RING finger family 4 domain-containing protein n=1 Tax=Nonomuraea sp. PA05 TaxID=2604466 RepID=UPI00165282C1|nr:RING finger family 4 domain-containing protein [Nonomuraea sp. PA05]